MPAWLSYAALSALLPCLVQRFLLAILGLSRRLSSSPTESLGARLVGSIVRIRPGATQEGRRQLTKRVTNLPLQTTWTLIFSESQRSSFQEPGLMAEKSRFSKQARHQVTKKRSVANLRCFACNPLTLIGRQRLFVRRVADQRAEANNA